MNIMCATLALFASFSTLASDHQCYTQGRNSDNESHLPDVSDYGNQLLEDSLFAFHDDDISLRKRSQRFPKDVSPHAVDTESKQTAKRQRLAKLAAEIFSNQEVYFSDLVNAQNSSEFQLDCLADDNLGCASVSSGNNEALLCGVAEDPELTSSFFEQETAAGSFLSMQADRLPNIDMLDSDQTYLTHEVDSTFDSFHCAASSVTVSATPCSNASLITTEASEQLRYTCNHCPFSTESIEEWALHLQSQHNIKIGKCKHDGYQDVQRKSGLNKQMLTTHADERPHVCDRPNCGKAFKTPTHLKTHIYNIHSDERPYVCDKSNCGKAFKTSTHMYEHMRNMHSDAKPYVCNEPTCTKAFKTSTHLLSHIRNMHSDDRPHVCDKPNCAKAFKTRSTLKEHQKYKHSDARPYECDHEGCDKTFKTPSDRNRHMRNLHSKCITTPLGTLMTQSNDLPDLDNSLSDRGAPRLLSSIDNAYGASSFSFQDD